MSYYFELRLLVIIIACFRAIQANFIFFDLEKIIETKDFYQITSFVSHNLTNQKLLSSSLDFPQKLYSFYENRPTIHNFYSKEFYKYAWAIQGSLVTFHTSNLNEVQPFVDFFMSQLSVRKRPNCLITYSSKNLTRNQETDIIGALKHAWMWNFLDVSLIVGEKSVRLYYLDPFMNIVFRKQLLEKNNEIFPDKLLNTHGYPFYIPTFDSRFYLVTHMKRPRQKSKIFINNYFLINFVANYLYFEVVKRNVSYDEYPIPYNFLYKWTLDVYPNAVIDMNYLYNFLIPADDRLKNIVAFVPTIALYQIDFICQMFINILVVSGLFFLILLTLSYFKVELGYFQVFDLVKILLGQSIAKEPQETLHRIVLLTIILAMVKISNDFLLDTIIVQYDEKEVPFESYEDLYNSQLQTYSYLPILKILKMEDANLNKVLNRTLIVNETVSCFNTLIKSKNLSCIMIPYDSDWIITNYKSPDGSIAMKVAQPPIFTEPLKFFWFSHSSPYAEKFLEIMRRVKETSLMHLPALVYEKSAKLLVDYNAPKISDGIRLEQLLIILSFFYTVSMVTFVSELIIFKIFRHIKKFT